jgi:hypothetical protein
VIRGVLLVVRFLFMLFVVRLMVRGLVPLFVPGRKAAPAGPASPGAIEDLVRDRVCNTFVPRARALTAAIGGREEHFCSAACRDRALQEVSRAS